VGKAFFLSLRNKLGKPIVCLGEYLAHRVGRPRISKARQTTREAGETKKPQGLLGLFLYNQENG
jgi:hypothetical protein